VGPISTVRKLSAALAVCATLVLPLACNAAADVLDSRGWMHPATGTWSGVYVGGSLGAAWGESDFVFTGGVSPLTNPQDFDSVFAGGFHLGIQRQWDRIVAGIETSVLFGNFDSSSPCPVGPFSCSVEMSRIWMIGPRLGFATSNFHFYGTGGYALGRLESKVTDASGAVLDDGHGRHNGWYLGGGVEWSIGRSMLLGVEYRRIELDDAWHRSSVDPISDRTIDATIDTIQARLTFKLGEIVR
jgi:opacity protein-like surface antigen